MLLLNGISSCFFYLREAETDACADGFADDANITALAANTLRSQAGGRKWVADTVQKPLTLLGEFGALTKQVVNAKKTLLWVADPDMRKELGKLRFNGEALTVVNAARQLGAFLELQLPSLCRHRGRPPQSCYVLCRACCVSSQCCSH